MSTVSAVLFEPWTEWQASSCVSSLYNPRWDGYRLADMLQSRAQQLRPEGGIAYHLKHFPDSFVALADRDYAQHPDRAVPRVGVRFAALWAMNCTNQQARPATAAAPTTLSEREALALMSDPVWASGQRLSGACPYPIDDPHRSLGLRHRYNMLLPAASALLDMVYRERQAGATPSAADDAMLRSTAAVHLRAGDVLDLSPHDVDHMLARHTRFVAACAPGARPWAGTPCMRMPPFDYVMPLFYYEAVRQALCEHGITLVVLVVGSALNLTRGFRKSCEYIERVGGFFARAGFRVAIRMGRAPDDDVRYVARVGVFVPSGGAYSRYAAAVAEALGVRVLRPNRTLYASVPSSVAAMRHLERSRTQCATRTRRGPSSGFL